MVRVTLAGFAGGLGLAVAAVRGGDVGLDADDGPDPCLTASWVKAKAPNMLP